MMKHHARPEPSGEPVRVLIVDDHRMVAEGLATILHSQPDMQVVAITGTVESAVRACSRLAPDVVVMDHLLPDGEGTDAARRIRAERPDVRIVMVTASAKDTVVAAAIEAGCSALVTKDRASEEVADAVRAAHEGDGAPSPELLARLSPRPDHDDQALVPLSARELEVLEMVADGQPNATIAESLVISVSTVRNHVQNILRKLDAHSRLEAVAIAVRQGLIRYSG